MREITLKTVKRKTTVTRIAVRKAIQAVFREDEARAGSVKRSAKNEPVKKATAKTK